MNNYFELVETAFREILASGLSPFVKREMKAKYGENWVTSGKISLQSYHVIKGDLNWLDMQALLKLIINQWNDLFKQKLGYSARGYVSELIEVRNNLKHESRDTFDFDYSYRALDSIERLLFMLPNDHIAEGKSREAADRKKELLATLTISRVEKIDKKVESSSVPWHEICGVMLLQKQRDSLRRKATQVGAEVNVYVALDLLQREERSRNDSSSKLDKESKKPIYEIEKTYKHDDFLESLTQRQGKNKHIAIAGGAGAGKTTLLATIAEKFHQQGQLTIFISLADLQDKSLYAYIYDSWLPSALGLRKGRATEDQKNDLHEQFKLGKVWLLLDGLDEMQSKSSANALVRIESEIRDLIEQSKVVLTCRLNVWDVNLNGLSNFDTFRMGKFSHDDVDKFISEWFIKVERPESAPILQAKLNEPNRDRIRDMVRHPLRLALLCQAFYRDLNTELPETKAGLYELFVRYFYEWKPNIVEEDLTQDTLRKELHQALGKLAIAGINNDAGFRLLRSLAVKEMGDRLFKLSIDLGWLTLIDLDELDQEVYAFYHASFQEYFAALAIDDWEFFLPQILQEPIITTKYLVFESAWKEVILFWLGNESKEVNIQVKEKFVKALVEFDDNCQEFYSFRAYFIAAEVITEFKKCSLSDSITEQIIIWGFGKFDIAQQEWITFPEPIQKSALAILPRIDCERATSSLCQLINNVKISNESRDLAIDHLVFTASTGKAREQAINLLVAFIETSIQIFSSSKKPFRLFSKKYPEPLIDNYSNNENMIRTLTHTAWSLGMIAVGNESAIYALVNLINNLDDSTGIDIRRQAAWSLGEITLGETSKIVIPVLIRLMEYSEDEFPFCKASSSLLKIANREGNKVLIRELICLLESSSNENVRKEASSFLRLLVLGEEWEARNNNMIAESIWMPMKYPSLDKKSAIRNAILNLIDPIIDSYKTSTKSLLSLIDEFNKDDFRAVVSSLRASLNNEVYVYDYPRYNCIYQIVWECSKNMSYPDFYSAWHDKPKSFHPEVEDNSPTDNVDAVSRFNKLISDS